MLKKLYHYVKRAIREMITDVRVARRVRAMKRKDPFIY